MNKFDVPYFFSVLRKFKRDRKLGTIGFMEFVKGVSQEKWIFNRKNILGRNLAHQAVIKSDKGVLTAIMNSNKAILDERD